MSTEGRERKVSNRDTERLLGKFDRRLQRWSGPIVDRFGEEHAAGGHISRSDSRRTLGANRPDRGPVPQVRAMCLLEPADPDR